MLAAVALVAALGSAADVRAEIEKDRWREALDQARALAEASPEDADARTALAEALYRAGLIDESAETAAALAARDDAPPRALVQLGLARAAQGRDEEAAGLLNQAADKAPADAWILFRTAGAAETRARAVERLEAYLAHGEGDDPDRIESAKGTIRLYRALGERKVWVPDARPDRLEIPLKPLLGSGPGRGWMIEAVANGRKIRLLLDTGSTGLFVVERALKKTGLAPLPEETVFAGGGAGRTRSGRGILPGIAFGALSFRDALVTTTTEEFDPQGRIHGVVGLSVFSGYRVTLDLARGKLTLDKEADLATGSPFWTVSGQMLVRGSAAEGSSALFLLDTGAVRSSLDASYVKGVPGAQIASAAAVRTYGGDVAGATTVRGVTIRFEGQATKGEPVTAADLTQRSRLSGVEVSGFLGLDLLDGKIVVVDTRTHRVAVSLPAKN